MRIADALVRQGTARDREDMLFVPANGEGIYGVADGVSEPYSPTTGGPRRDAQGTTGGQHVVTTLARKILFPQPGKNLEQILLEANSELRQLEGWVDDAGLIPGASLALAEVSKNAVFVITAGDAFAVWQTKTGFVGATPNPTFHYDLLNRHNLATCLAESGGNTGKAWDLHLPFAKKHAREHKNVDFAEFNGQGAFLGLCTRTLLDPRELQRLVVFTDGMVKFEWTEHPNLLAQRIMHEFEDGMLREVLVAAHGWKNAHNGKHPEATAIALEF